MKARAARILVLVTGTSTLVLLAVVGVNSRSWIGSTFPGFFVMANRVVPSISLPSWLEVPSSHVFQRQVLEVEGRPVRTSREIYERVRALGPRRPVRYVLRSSDGTRSEEVVRSKIFSGTDYLLLFGAYLLNGLAFAGIALAVFWMKPEHPASLGLFSAGLATGVFILTAVDLYGPHWFFRLHVLAESLLPATFLHLGLVFPKRRVSRRGLLAIYAPFFLLAALYEAFLADPSAYSLFHLAATAELPLAGLVLMGTVTYDFFTTDSPLLRRRIGLVALGTVAAFLFPSLLIGASSALGGGIPINAGAFTAFLFPLGLAYAILKQDLFEIDVVLRRGVSYAIVLLAISAGYFAALYAYGSFVPGGSLVPSSPGAFASLNLGFVLLMAPLHSRVQKAVDRVYFRNQYDADTALAALGQALGGSPTEAEITEQAGRIFAETFRPDSALLLRKKGDRWVRRSAGGEVREFTMDLPRELLDRLEGGESVARYRWDEGREDEISRFWRNIDAEILVPVRSGQAGLALLALGRKASGRPYNVSDLTFLRAAANQIALALANAAVLAQASELNRKLERLNASLEEKVRERTAAVEAANAELSRSLRQLRVAYRQLEESQAGLLRAERLATLGRLAAGIAHEVNTPLSAVRNALKVLVELAEEYAASIDDPQVSPEDHHEIAREMATTARAAVGWAEKAAAFIRSVKTQGREVARGEPARFQLRKVVEETQALLAHRLRATSCTVEYREEPEGLEVVGDPSRLGQVLVNLVGNAIDAYEDAGSSEGRIEVRAARERDKLVVAVRDWAGGIAPEVLPHVFELLFTTKEPGRGTGLGLWISRNLVEEGFGGTLEVVTEPGEGSCFVATLPLRPGSREADGAAPRPPKPEDPVPSPLR
ncbi:MAG: hypothetical protein KatS3mg076_2074 [Candidatus Binatia bacterium]|nr:MAG: hypothetical protein KatS3mg076_2074 [Candidatus Binatia bacterium]